WSSDVCSSDLLRLSGWQDSNLRPPGPKPGAMTGLRYTPIRSFIAERQGFEPWRRLPVDRLAICSVTTPAPLLKSIRFCDPTGARTQDPNIKSVVLYQLSYRVVILD